MSEKIVSRIYTPAGDLTIECDKTGKKVFKIEFGTEKSEKLMCEKPELEISKQLCEYFEGRRKKFEIEFELEGTEFQKKVLKELLKIPYGITITYKELAERVGNSNSSRAVGNVMAKNRIPIIIPCHRVVSKKGLGGFGGGLVWKKFLLELERRNNR
jgi:methylated-DNA-[protein]-cysteine S-methyltransferase